MAKTYPSYDALTDEIMFAINDAVAGSRFGVSARSVSRYVELSIEDEDGEEIELRRVRISDHAATASCGGGIVYEVDIRGFFIEEINDDYGEFDHIEVTHDWLIDDAVAKAVAALRG